MGSAKLISALIFAIILAVLVVPMGRVRAYSIETSSTKSSSQFASGTLNDLLSPFDNFVNTLNSIGGIPQLPSIPLPVVPQVQALPSAPNAFIENVLQNVDGWFYGVAGFHIAAFAKGTLSIFSRLLGVIKNGVDWIATSIR